MDMNEYITQSEAICGGRPIIKESRMPVRAIAGCFNLGLTLDEIFDSYPHLKPQQICAALTYYFENQEEIDKDIEADSVQNLKRKYREQKKPAHESHQVVYR